MSRTHLEADKEREWNSDEEHAPESNSELRADKEKDGREHHESQRRKKPQKPMLAVSPAKIIIQPQRKNGLASQEEIYLTSPPPPLPCQ